jgi:hypothetical protein
MSDDLILDSLQRRMRALHSVYRDAVATMDLGQVNHFEREGVLPIAFSLFHIVNMMDASGTAAYENDPQPAIWGNSLGETYLEMSRLRFLLAVATTAGQC